MWSFIGRLFDRSYFTGQNAGGGETCTKLNVTEMKIVTWTMGNKIKCKRKNKVTPTNLEVASIIVKCEGIA